MIRMGHTISKPKTAVLKEEKTGKGGGRLFDNSLFIKCFLFVVGYLAGTLRPTTTVFLSEDNALFVPSSSAKESVTADSAGFTSVAETATIKSKNNDDGWKCVDVFYGKKIVENIPEDTSMTQANQDKIVSALFRHKRRGYFVDLAANNAIDMSNTYSLERRYEWRGLCIEPNPTYWRNLTFYRDCSVVAAVVGQNRMEEVQFHFDLWGGVGGGIVGSGFDNKPSREKTSLKMYTARVEDILQRHGAPSVIDYLSLDVEGAEDFVMDSFPFDKYRIKVLTVERPKPRFFTIMEEQGYRCVGEISKFGEHLWVHKDFESDLDMESVHNVTTITMRKCRLR
mmetsp:Transcript_53059/g.60085  ORF Transcript_53059/g.60085 Transcript_53059/m.60085 type:complete len:339 (-) Transcript_53059:430-1446(-)